MEAWRKCKVPNCDGLLVWIDDHYGSLGSGGSYEEYTCEKCNTHRTFMLPD